MRDELDTKDGQKPPEEEKKKNPGELTDQDLDSVAGGTGHAQSSGRVDHGDIKIIKVVDKSSALL